MKSSFINQQHRIVPNPFVIGDVTCLCKCPKHYFTEKSKVSYRLSALIPEKPNNPGTSFNLNRELINLNPDPTSTQATPDFGLYADMTVGTGQFLFSNKVFQTVDDPDNLIYTFYDTGTTFTAGDPLPEETFLGTITGFPEQNIPAPVGDEVPNEVAAGLQVTYFDTGFAPQHFADGVIKMVHTAPGIISVYLIPATPGALIPADYYAFVNANLKFTQAVGGTVYRYTVTSDAGKPATGDTKVELYYSTGPTTTAQFDETHTPEEWEAGVVMLELTPADDPTVNSWPEPVQINSAVLPGFIDRYTYRSDKPFIVIGFADLSAYTGRPNDPVKNLWAYNITDSVSYKDTIKNFITACQIAASKEPGGIVTVFETLYTSFERDNYYAYFENAMKQVEYNQTVFTTPGMTDETITAPSTAVASMVGELTKQTEVYQMAEHLFNATDLNLFLPPGLYSIGSDDSYTEKFEDYLSEEDHYPYLVVLQLLP